MTNVVSRPSLALWVALLGAEACSLDVGGSAVDLGRIHPPSADAGTLDAASRVDAALEEAEDAAIIEVGDADTSSPSDAGPPRQALCDDPALVVCYPFDVDALDHGPRSNHLDALNVSYEPEGGVRLQAASQLACTKNETLSHGQTSVLLWLRVDQLPMMGRAGVIDHDGQYGIFLHPGGELRCAMAISAASVASKAAAVQAGTWHHVACIAEGTNTRLYVDGALVASAPGAVTRTPALSPLNLGENSPDGADQLIGALDDVRILEADLTAQQVQTDLQRGRSAAE